MKFEIDPQDREILSIIMELSKAVRCCRQDEVFCEDVTFTQFVILDSIAAQGMLNMARLHADLGVDKSTTTRLVAPLIRRGLLVRDKAGHDSRAAILTLTADGQMVHARVWQCLIGFVRAIQDEIPHHKRDEVLHGIDVFLKAMQQVAARRYAGSVDASCCTGAAMTCKASSAK